jgi:hypothetical protein
MKMKPLLSSASLAFAVVLALASASATTLGNAPSAAYQIVQNEPRNEPHPNHHEHQTRNRRPLQEPLNDEWYQGRRGHWYQEKNGWQWRSTDADDWYQGQRGHWYEEPNGWQFGSAGIVCGAYGCNCRVGGYLPPNGEGMVDSRNQNLYWACDSEGHHCHWARRPQC